jgi:nucleoside-diphosphate-sugar epimerase
MFPPAVFEKENNQLFDRVIKGTFNLLEAAYKVKDLSLFLYASTDAVYATGPRKFTAPITEETELFPSRFYALAKIVCETMCVHYGKLYNLPWLIVRICWTLDVDELPTLLSYEFWEGSIDLADRDRLKSEIGNGKGLFAPLMMNGESGVDQVAAPEDIADGIVRGIERFAKAKNNVYNLAGPAPFKYLDIVKKLAGKFDLPWGSAPVKGIEPYEIVIEKAKRVLGYNPGFTAEMMFERALRKKIYGNSGQ